jgi:hypothetical protein
VLPASCQTLQQEGLASSQAYLAVEHALHPIENLPSSLSDLCTYTKTASYSSFEIVFCTVTLYITFSTFHVHFHQGVPDLDFDQRANAQRVIRTEETLAFVHYCHCLYKFCSQTITLALHLDVPCSPQVATALPTAGTRFTISQPTPRTYFFTLK